ncbi:hypothetical protein BH09BAC1_BH09BAC1_13660 [soil metagenome]
MRLNKIGLYIIYLILTALITSCDDTNKESSVPKSEKQAEHTDGGYQITNYYPFSLLDDPRNTIAIYLYNSEDSILIKYAPIFEKYGYSGNGESWAGHIEQILEQVDPELLKHIDFDPEGDAFFAYVDTKENQLRIANILVPIFTDFNKLEKHLASANSERIWD